MRSYESASIGRSTFIRCLELLLHKNIKTVEEHGKNGTFIAIQEYIHSDTSLQIIHCLARDAPHHINYFYIRFTYLVSGGGMNS